MSTVATKKTPKRKASRKRAPKKVENIGKEYTFSSEESAVCDAIEAKFELANEKEQNVAELRKSAKMLRAQWLEGMLARRSIDRRKKINVNIDNSTITVMGEK